MTRLRQGSGGQASPQRVQLRRTKGWRMPPNTASVARPTKWGNPFVIGEWNTRPNGIKPVQVVAEDAADAVRLYRRFLSQRLRIEARLELRGKNLACWCKPGDPCHADVLLKLANRDPTS